MKANRHAVLAAASLLAAIAVSPAIVKADDQQPPPGQGKGEKENKHRDKDNRGDGGEQRQWKGGQRDQQGGEGHQGQNRERPGKPEFGQQAPPQKKQFNGGEGRNPNPNPNAFVKPQPNVQPKPPAFDNAVVPPSKPQQLPNQGQQQFNNEFGHKKNERERNKNQADQQQKEKNWKRVTPGTPQQPTPNPTVNPNPSPQANPGRLTNPTVNPGSNPQGNPGQFTNPTRFNGQNPNSAQQPSPQPQPNPTINPNPSPQANPGQFTNPTRFNGQNPDFVQQPSPQPLSAEESKKQFEALRSQRKEVKFDGGKGVVIEEPGKRRIIRENNRVFIQHDDTERLRRVDPNARFEKGKGGVNVAVIDRPGGYKVYSETDANGQLLRRYRRGPDGRDVIIIDNRRRYHDNFGRDLAAGVGIGVGIVAGAAILNSVLDVPPPRVTIPRDEYIVDYGRASDEDVYYALSAPPVEDFRDRYTLDEIRATAALRDRMRRIDLDDITFDFGSWVVNPSQYGKLDRIASAMRRIIDRNPNEVFMIEGYTDAVGSPEDNLSLSDRRAESVAEVLSRQFQIPFENLTTQGYGEQYLKIPTQAPERLNRRVAVRRITPLLARGNGGPPPPRPDDRQPAYDDRQGGPDDGGGYDQGPGGYDGPPPQR